MGYSKVPQEIFDKVNDNIKALEQLFPSAVKDGEVDFDALKEELGQFDEVGKEKFELTWAGKQNAIKIANEDILGRTLKFLPEDGKDEDTTENLYIEGDNLEVLKLLRQNYYNSIKMIYIDPPYNTGKDFIYNDKYSMSRKKSEIIEGDVDITGERLTVNQKGTSRFHSNWLNMIYPRLLISKDLLSDDGVIFISIDDNEVSNLRKVCDSIFGEDNFEGHIHWRRRHNQPNDKTKMIGLVAEHILVYAKNKKILKENGVGKIDLTGEFSNPDNDPRGEWGSKPWKVGSDQSGSRYKIVSPTGKIFEEEWMGDEDNFRNLLNDNRIYFTRNGDGFPRKKYFKTEREGEGQCATNWWTHEVFGHNQGANDTVTKLFGEKNIFSNPKPVELIRGLIQIANVKDGDIVLDFFSGSSSTAHSVMQLNAEDNLNRKFIMVQLPEDLEFSLTKATGDAKKTIQNAITFLQKINKPLFLTEVGKERIRRAGESIKEENKEKEYIGDVDFGFKVLRTADTNIRWTHEALTTGQTNMSEMNLSDKDRIDFMPEFTDINVIYEIMLRQRDIPLSSEIEKLNQIGERTYIFADSYLVCLEEIITEEIIQKLAAIEPLPIKFIFRDSAFEDDISLKDETFRRLQLLIERNTGDIKNAYTIEFL